MMLPAIVVAAVVGSPVFAKDVAHLGAHEPIVQWLSAVDLHPAEYGVIYQTNHQRRHFGLPPLELCPSLLKSARQHATWMTTTGKLTHSTAHVGENIAMGQTSCPEVVAAWMNSPGHRANILNPAYRRIGAASYTTPDGTIYWCQQFLQ